MRNFKIICLILLSILVVNSYALDKVITKEYYIPYNKQKIYLKEKKLSSIKSSKVIILVNPLSIPTLNAFDVPNYSLMDTLAQNGYDVWGIDFIGEGNSSYPKEMQESPAPIGVYPLQAIDAVKQLNSVINYITKYTKQNNVAILGWSWGSVVGAMYAIDNPKKVNHLVLYGAMYATPLESSIRPIFIQPYADANNKFNESLPAYQNIPWQVINTHWNMMLQGNQSIVSESAIQAVEQVYVTADHKPFVADSLRRPMGPMKDLYSIWNGNPIYDISRLKTPTLVIYGDQDLFADKSLYSKLINVKIKKEVQIINATHWLIYENGRNQFINQVIKFLNNEK